MIVVRCGGGGSASDDPFVMEDAMFLAAALSIVGLSFICWVLFNLAVYALPFFAGVSAGMLAYQTGAGAIGAMLVGLVAGVVTLVFGQLLFASIRTPAIRSVVALVYAGPAAIAGYHAVHGLSAIGGAEDSWRQAFSVTGAMVIAGVAWSRMSLLRPGGHSGTSEPSQRTVAG